MFFKEKANKDFLDVEVQGKNHHRGYMFSDFSAVRLHLPQPGVRMHHLYLPGVFKGPFSSQSGYLVGGLVTIHEISVFWECVIRC